MREKSADTYEWQNGSCTFAKRHEMFSRLGHSENLRNFANIGMMGHQIGIDVHEVPWWPDETFMRTKDKALTNETGCEPLTMRGKTDAFAWQWESRKSFSEVLDDFSEFTNKTA